MPISQSLVQLMGGVIEVRSPFREGQTDGTRFEFVVTFHDDDDDDVDGDDLFKLGSSRGAVARGKRATQQEQAALQDTTGHILIADDDEMNRLVMKYLLEKIIPQWVISEAATAEEAVAFVKEAYEKSQKEGEEQGGKGKVDIIMMDEDFGYDATARPRQLGTDATKEIRAYLDAREAEGPEKCFNEDEDAKRPTFIFGATGFESERHRPVALAAGQNHVLGKPFKDDEVRAVLIAFWLRALPPVFWGPYGRPPAIQAYPQVQPGEDVHHVVIKQVVEC